MTKVGIVVLADTETHGDLGRVANALTSAKEFKEAGDEVTVIFDGAGTSGYPSSPTQTTGSTATTRRSKTLSPGPATTVRGPSASRTR